jgi:hypothetical protein
MVKASAPHRPNQYSLSEARLGVVVDSSEGGTEGVTWDSSPPTQSI